MASQGAIEESNDTHGRQYQCLDIEHQNFHQVVAEAFTLESDEIVDY